MPEIISNTSPLLYLYRIEALEWLPKLCSQDIWVPSAVVIEIEEGRRLVRYKSNLCKKSKDFSERLHFALYS
jgi:hypothetical protein